MYRQGTTSRTPGYTYCYTPEVLGEGWDVYVVTEVREWIEELDDATHARVVQAIDALAEGGPGLGRPLVDTISGSSIQNLKELRPGTVRICSPLTRGAPASYWSPVTRPGDGKAGTRRPFRWPSTGMRST